MHRLVLAKGRGWELGYRVCGTLEAVLHILVYIGGLTSVGWNWIRGSVW